MLWGTGKARREFLHVDDMAAACLHIMAHHEGVELINVGCGQDLTIRGIAELVQQIVGFTGEVRWDAAKPDGTPRKQLDVTRLTAMGWHAAIALEEGIKDVYAWYQNEL